jgi:anti-sigma regulatory factor (Ser/Thr protein kinase)/DNA-binding transcriptional ArsR family regulator
VATHTFYPFVERERTEDIKQQPTPTEPKPSIPPVDEVKFPARIAVYDDAAAAPRVLIIDPSDVRNYLEEITQTVTKLSHEQGGSIPFMVIREIVENLIHAYFIEPAISILPGGNTIRFSDQGPGIKEKDRAMEYGTTSATEDMKRYIRGVGSGLPYANQYLLDKGGSLLIEDNMARGTVVTISMEQHVKKEPIQSMSPETENALPLVSDAALKFPKISTRGKKILKYLRSHELVGPKELIATYGYSAATWSRELRALDEDGITIKERDGQKRHLTPIGRSVPTD